MEGKKKKIKQNRLFVVTSITNFKSLDIFFMASIPKTLLGPVQGAAVIIALLLQPQWLCEVCAVGYCFAYKELSDLQSSQGHT